MNKTLTAMMAALILLAVAAGCTDGPSVAKTPPQARYPAPIPDFTSKGFNDQGREEFIHKPTGMLFVLIPAGTFMMGSEDGDENERPVHRVNMSAFLMGKYEVMQGEYEKLMGANPSYFKEGSDQPVENVAWDDCARFCEKAGLRLPTEAQWEYACRAGSTGEFFWTASHDGDYAWYDHDWARGHFKVGQKLPNAFGLHDMSGNVWEWCQDYYEADYYARAPVDDPKGADESEKRSLRGGSWWYVQYYMRMSFRAGYLPGCRNDDTGFRCAAPLP